MKSQETAELPQEINEILDSTCDGTKLVEHSCMEMIHDFMEDRRFQDYEGEDVKITIDHELLRHQRLHISITILNLLSCKRLFNLELWESARKHWNRAVQWAWKQQTWKKQKIQRILLLVLYFHLEIQLQENEGCAREWAFHRFGDLARAILTCDFLIFYLLRSHDGCYKSCIVSMNLKMKPVVSMIHDRQRSSSSWFDGNTIVKESKTKRRMDSRMT